MCVQSGGSTLTGACCQATRILWKGGVVIDMLGLKHERSVSFRFYTPNNTTLSVSVEDTFPGRRLPDT